MGASELWTGDNTVYQFTEPTLLDPQQGSIFYSTNSPSLTKNHTKSVESIYTEKMEKQTNESDSTFSMDDNSRKGSISAITQHSLKLDTALQKYPLHFKYALMTTSLCNNSSITFDEETQEWKAIGDPTEVALVVASEKAKLGKSYWEQQGYRRVFENAFDSERKLMSVIYKDTNDQDLMLCKGAPEELLRKCKYYISPDETHEPLDDAFDAKVYKESSRMACQGLRVLGLAYKDTNLALSKDDFTTRDTANEPAVPMEYMEQGLTFIGLIGLIDPPKKGVKEAIQTCQEAGIRVMMITGDHVKTATAIATQLGIFNADHTDKVCGSTNTLAHHSTCNRTALFWAKK
jgi:Ca2+-transporting ATPase